MKLFRAATLYAWQFRLYIQIGSVITIKSNYQGVWGGIAQSSVCLGLSIFLNEILQNCDGKGNYNKNMF